MLPCAWLHARRFAPQAPPFLRFAAFRTPPPRPLCKPHWMSGHAVHRPGVFERWSFLDIIVNRRHVYQREIPNLPVACLLEIVLRAGPRGRDSNRGEQISRLQDRHTCNVNSRANEIVFGVYHALTLRRADHHFCIEGDQGRRRVRGIDGNAAVCVKNSVLAVQTCGRIRVTNVATGTVARPAAPVIPATSILRNVSAKCSLIANLRGRGRLRPPAVK